MPKESHYGRHDTDRRTKSNLTAAERLAVAERLLTEDWSDEEIERLASVTLEQIVELRAQRAAGAERGREGSLRR